MTTLLDDTIRKTRQWFADNALACVAEATAGVFHVNDLVAYVTERKQFAADALAGEHDHTFTFRQQTEYLQTGKCTPLLANANPMPTEIKPIAVGHKVEVRCRNVMGDRLLFTGTVVRLTKTRVIVIDPARPLREPHEKPREHAFNRNTGYKIGAKPTKGIGCSFEPRYIEIPQAIQP